MRINQINPIINQTPIPIQRQSKLQNTSCCSNLADRIKNVINRFIAWVKSLSYCCKNSHIVPIRTTPTVTYVPPLLDMTRLGIEQPYDDYVEVIDDDRIRDEIIDPIEVRITGDLIEDNFVLPHNHYHRKPVLNYISDRIEAAIWAQALGDAMGVLTSTLTRAQAAALIQGRPLEFALKDHPDFLAGPGHEIRASFTSNGWTDNTDHTINLVEAEINHNLLELQGGNAIRNRDSLFAESLNRWRDLGLRFINLNGNQVLRFDGQPEMHLNETLGFVIGHGHFQLSPQRVAHHIWIDRHFTADNGALVRNGVVASLDATLSRVIDASIRYALTTHADPRCVASCAAHTTAIYMVQQGCDNFDEILQASSDVGLAYLDLFLRGDRRELDAEQLAQIQTFKNEFRRYLHAQSWDDLAMDTGDTSYTVKTLGAAFYTLKLAMRYEQEVQNGRQLPENYTPARLALEELIAQGGDADSNGATAGTLLGGYFGNVNMFPESWKEGLRERDRVILELANEKIINLRTDPAANQPINN